MIIREMTGDDVSRIAELESKIFSDPWSESSFEYEVFHNEYSIPLVLEDGEEIIGYTIIWKMFEEFHIANFALRPESQGKQIGSAFFREVLKLADGCDFALLEVRETNVRAIHLYKKFGFRIIMRRRAYYRDGEDALVMQKIFDAAVRNRKTGDIDLSGLKM